MPSCTIGVMAHNEETTIVPVLHALLSQRLHDCTISEILVIASGCTDRTVERAREVAARHPLVSVEVEPERSGKAAAINHLIARARGELIVLVGADTLPDPTAIEQLTAPFADPKVGMTGARVVPLNDPRTFMGFTVQMLWHIHHRLALRWPKLGELVAFRNVVQQLPSDTATDEVALEALLSSQGFRLVYTPDAIVYNYGPETLRDFFIQRRRIFAGHLNIALDYNYVASSMSLKNLLSLTKRVLTRYPDLIPKMIAVALLELAARGLGTLDVLTKRHQFIWQTARTTKQLHRHGNPPRMILLYCRPDSIKAQDMLRRLTRVPSSYGTLLWWDTQRSKVVFLLPDEQLSGEELEAHIARLNGFLGGVVPDVVVSYELMPFTPEGVVVTRGAPAHSVAAQL
jgi:poly-beta-1,6-N-acetyl-D-glucosamine synthase